MDIKELARDTTKIEAGEWVDDLPEMGDLRLKVRGSSSKLYTAKLGALARKATRDERDRHGNVRTDVMIRLMGEAAHETLLLDWDGLTKDGKPFPYDKAIAKEWLTNPDHRSFFDAVFVASNVVDHGREENKKEMAKNL